MKNLVSRACAVVEMAMAIGGASIVVAFTILHLARPTDVARLMP